jgi:hypothetical protein
MEEIIMGKEESVFTVGENDLEKEVISIAEDEIEGSLTAEAVDGFGLGPGMGLGMGLGPGGFGAAPCPKEEEESKDWRVSKKPEHFLVFLTKDLQRIPKPSQVRGNMSEMERALGQYKRLNAYISNAMHSDYDGVINVKQIDSMRKLIEQSIDELEDALDGLKQLKKEKKKMRRRGEEEEPDLKKEATAPHFNGFQMLITPFQRAIAGALINGKVSGGRNLEELWSEAKKKYKMEDREELEILQILADMGYPEFRDRLRLGDNNDPTRTKEFGEWQSQYYG